ncbi:MAG: hypothetical protein HC876_20620 [Chloroflexaceae bacterium]|nr:hypothetical protein [Chloroflexaceae bacterium]
MLIDNVLNLSRIEMGYLKCHESSFNLSYLIASVERLFTLSIQHKGIAFTVTIAPDVPRMIVTDEMKLRQVLMNLLSNAVKFTKQGGVSVCVTCAGIILSDDRDDSDPNSVGCRLLFEVEDTGPGIPADELDDLFDTPFVQPRTNQWVSEGGRMGLAVCRGYVQLMGGDMTVRSEVGHGSVFAFDIRVRLGCPRHGTPQQSPPHRCRVGSEPAELSYPGGR